MAGPILGHQDAAQIGVAGKPDAEQIKDLALAPVRGGPDSGDTFDYGSLARKKTLQSQPLFALVGKQMIDDFKARFCGPPINRCNVGEKTIAAVVFEYRRDPTDARRSDPKRPLATLAAAVQHHSRLQLQQRSGIRHCGEC
jgi:hypothetical protein